MLESGADNLPLPIRAEVSNGKESLLTVFWTAPANWPSGAPLPLVLTAKSGPTTLRRVRFTPQPPDLNADGLSDTVAQLMLQGMPPNTRITVNRPPVRPYTSVQTPRLPDPRLDLQTDALFAYTTSAEVISGWKQRGVTVWTMGGSRTGKDYATQHPDEVQTDAKGNPITIGGDSYYLNPTANRIAAERAYYEQALLNGSDGICPEEPEYFARGGYEGAFKTAWQQQFKSPWLPPDGSVEARWRAGQLMATLETDHISALLQSAAQTKPEAKRMVALHSPINYAQWGIVCPQYRITSLPTVQEVIGQVWTGTARTPARYAGIRQDRTFSIAYLEYSSLCQLLRGTGKHLWFLMDPLEDDPNRSQTDYRSHYEQTLIAALLFPEVDSYEVMPWPERVYGNIPADYAIEINSVIAALQDMHNQTNPSGNAIANANIGVFVSDSMQWQRESPVVSDFDGFYGLALPLLQRGIPVQAVSLDRASEPGYLKPFKTLLLSYDYQKPPGIPTQAALADWVRQGGNLLFFGGSDPYNAVRDSWWRKQNLDAPQSDLWAQLGIKVGGPAITPPFPTADTNPYRSLLKGDGAEHDLRNRRIHTLDLTPFSQTTGSVAVRFSDVSPGDGWGAWVASAELRIGGKLAASFPAGSEIENRFLAYDKNSQFNGTARFADGPASWTLQFDNLPRNTPISLSIDMGNGFEISAAAAKPDYGHTLLSASTSGILEKAFPRLRIGATYPATIYPQIVPATPALPSRNGNTKPDRPTVLYTLRSGGAPVWTQSIGKGLVINVGVAPGFFSSSERSAGLLRALTQYACQRTGGTYRESDVLRLKRGRYTIVRTFDDSEEIEGRTIDLLSPTLASAEDRVIPPHSYALLYDLGPANGPPQIGFISGRVQAKIESSNSTAFYTRGPLGTTGVARLHSGGKRLTGARGMDRLGHPVPVQADPDGNTVLLKYPNDPDGVIVRIGWE